jgi:hypothetical protein
MVARQSTTKRIISSDQVSTVQQYQFDQDGVSVGDVLSWLMDSPVEAQHFTVLFTKSSEYPYNAVLVPGEKWRNLSSVRLIAQVLRNISCRDEHTVPS